MKKYFRLLGLLIMAYIIYRLDWIKFINLLPNINPLWLILAGVLNIPMVGLKIYRWDILLRAQGKNLKFSDICNYYMSALFLGMLTPGRSGELVRALYLVEHDVPFGKGLSSVFIDKAFDLGFFLILALAGVWFFDLFKFLSGYSIIVLLGVMVLVGLIFYPPAITKIVNLPLKRILKIKGFNNIHYLDNYLKGLKCLSLGLLSYVCLVTFFSFLIYFIQYHLLAISLGFRLPSLFLILAMSLSSLSSFFISISGIGLRDVILIQLFRTIGLGWEEAVLYSLFVFLNFFVLNGLIGFYYWMANPPTLSITPKVSSKG